MLPQRTVIQEGISQEMTLLTDRHQRRTHKCRIHNYTASQTLVPVRKHEEDERVLCTMAVKDTKGLVFCVCVDLSDNPGAWKRESSSVFPGYFPSDREWDVEDSERETIYFFASVYEEEFGESLAYHSNEASRRVQYRDREGR